MGEVRAALLRGLRFVLWPCLAMVSGGRLEMDCGDDKEESSK